MLKGLARSFAGVIQRVRGQGRLTEADVDAALGDIRAAMLEADVALPVADAFLESARTRAVGAKLEKSMNPGRAFAEIVRAQLAEMMGGGHAALRLGKPPAVILACGLQGAGKTTSMAKIAKMLKDSKKRVVLGSADIRRPAALEQLDVLAQAAGVPCIGSDETADATARAKDILSSARRQLADALLMDAAGRLAVDEEMMQEMAALRDALSPAETLFFVDATQGQDALNTARKFHETVPVSGIVLTKFDGDGRGGAALSARAVTGAPVKFIGVGERLEDIQPFHPARFASRILGMGDMESLAEQAVAAAGDGGARRAVKALKKPNAFDLNEQLEQIRQMQKMGGVGALAEQMPAGAAEKIQDASAGDRLKAMEAIILSMTPAERAAPEIIKASRKRRIARGAGAEVQDVNTLLAQHEQTRKIMKRFAKNPSGFMRMMGAALGR